MKFGIISDTHDRTAGIDAAIEFFATQKIELIIHCGDWKYLKTMQYFAEHAHISSLPVYGVLGNNDIEVNEFLSYAPKAPGTFEITEGVAEYKFGNVLVTAYHGHHRPILNKVLANTNYAVVVLGHSHKPRVEKLGGKIIVNPGSTAFSIPRSKNWLPTVAIVDTSTLQANIHTLTNVN